MITSFVKRILLINFLPAKAYRSIKHHAVIG